MKKINRFIKSSYFQGLFGKIACKRSARRPSYSIGPLGSGAPTSKNKRPYVPEAACTVLDTTRPPAYMMATELPHELSSRAAIEFSCIGDVAKLITTHATTSGPSRARYARKILRPASYIAAHDFKMKKDRLVRIAALQPSASRKIDRNLARVLRPDCFHVFRVEI